tara:strand:- start:255 stop:875 length:621 start_codon:yes stop_codon:yes gene_type:complete
MFLMPVLYFSVRHIIVEVVMKLDDEILDRAKKGDEDAISHILSIYKDLIRIKFRHLFIVGADREDVFQEGMIGLMKAIKHYDENRVSSFRAFADLCIQRQVITAIKRANAQKHNIANNAETTDVTEAVISENPERIFLSKEADESLSSFLNKNLSKFEFSVYQLLIQGYEYREIAIKLEKGPKSVDNAIQRIRKKGSSWLDSLRLF